MADSNREGAPGLEPGTVLIAPHPTETIEVLATPRETVDRYRLRLVAPPGGGPGIRGLGPHIHPGLVEKFRCVSGAMTVRVGSDLRDLAPGDEAEVPPGVLHGFVAIGSQGLVAEVEVVFTPPGPRPEADLVVFWAMVDRLIRDGRVSKRTGMPSLPHLAALLEQVPEAFQQPGFGGVLLKPLAVLGRLTSLRDH